MSADSTARILSGLICRGHWIRVGLAFATGRPFSPEVQDLEAMASGTLADAGNHPAAYGLSAP